MDRKASSVIQAMVDGYGKEFPNIQELLATKATPEQIIRLNMPIPELGRYHSSVSFLGNVTSGKVWGILRFMVIVEYFVALSEKLGDYRGVYNHKKIVDGLASDNIKVIRKIGRTIDEVVQAEIIEKFTNHDTAAAGDLVKIMIDHLLPHMTESVEGVHFGCTSEDVIGNVTGIVGNNLVYGHFLPKLMEFCLNVIGYIEKHQDVGMLVLPALTHKQSAEPTTMGKKFIVKLKAIDALVKKLLISENRFQPFSGKLGGATGNLTCHFAAYPDIDWWKFSNKFVNGLGLHYEAMTDQCSPYVIEAHIFRTIIDLLEQVIKLTRDFIDMVSCPGQLFVKLKKKGDKGSSIMPGKTNLWAMEGAIAMLEKTQNNLSFLAKKLQEYPHEGNMARSYLFRAIGGDFMPAFIGLGRIWREMKQCVPNDRKIKAFLNEYPGMAGSSLQSVLKRENIEGDAYREIQRISINVDGSYANAEEFSDGLNLAMNRLGLSQDVQTDLLELTDLEKLVEPVHTKAMEVAEYLKATFTKYIQYSKLSVGINIEDILN